jgi:hypothetical protein
MEAKVEISAGQQWRLQDASPWPNPHTPVTVVDVRDGWVRYDMTHAKDQRRKLDDFLNLYEIVPAEELA